MSDKVIKKSTIKLTTSNKTVTRKKRSNNCKATGSIKATYALNNKQKARLRKHQDTIGVYDENSLKIFLGGTR